MSRLTRKNLSVFGLSGGSSNFGQFGSQAASAPIETKDVEQIQSLAAWADGWQEAVALGQAPYLQDMNGWMYVHSYETGYLLQEGVPEWITTTPYYKGSIVKVLSSNYADFYCCLEDNSTGHAPTTRATDSHWQYMYSIHTGSGMIIQGTPTNDSAPVGAYGEYMNSDVTEQSFSGSATFIDITTLALTAGDWDLTGSLMFEQNSATIPDGLTGLYLSAYSGGTATDQLAGINYVNGYWHSTFGNQTALVVPNWRVSIAAGATYYMKASLTYNAGTPKCSGRFSARRAR